MQEFMLDGRFDAVRADLRIEDANVGRPFVHIDAAIPDPEIMGFLGRCLNILNRDVPVTEMQGALPLPKEGCECWLSRHTGVVG